MLELTREGKWLRNLETIADGANRRDAKLSGLDQPVLRFALAANERFANVKSFTRAATRQPARRAS